MRLRLPALCLLAPMLPGCVAPEVSAPTADAPRPERLHRVAEATRRVNASGIGDLVADGRLPGPEWRPEGLSPGPRGPEDLPDLSLLGAPISGELDPDRGEELQDFVAANIEERKWNSFGLAALTWEQIWGEDGEGGVCEEPAVIVEFKEDGADYEAAYGLGAYGSILGQPELQYLTMLPGCSSTIVESGGDLSQADGCDEYEEQSFFAEGSDCRACLEAQAGDWDGCVEAGSCLERAPLMSWTDDGTGRVWWRTGIAQILGCAPDLTTNIYVMADYGDDGSSPPAWDHAAWGDFCVPYWDERAGQPEYGCSPGIGGRESGHAMGAGAVGRVDYVRRAGEDGAPHHDRLWYAASVDLGRVGQVSWFWATNPGAGQISAPESGIQAGDPAPDLGSEPVSPWLGATWGMNPYRLRPDGEDPGALDDTFARDWLATLTLKTATTRDGVLINTANATRCDPGAWEGPMEDGSWRCGALLPPRPGWHNDAAVGAWAGMSTDGAWSEDDFPQVFYLPLTTLGSTGLPDPLVPGGNTVLIAGTEALADPGFDGCDWPHRFVPDAALYEDRPEHYGGTGWLWGDVWRFGKQEGGGEDLDLRVVLNTNEARGYCAVVE